MPWLERRGEHLIASHHPLGETLISHLGPVRVSRNQTRSNPLPRHDLIHLSR
jgi:hypothetical protein